MRACVRVCTRACEFARACVCVCWGVAERWRERCAAKQDGRRSMAAGAARTEAGAGSARPPRRPTREPRRPPCPPDQPLTPTAGARLQHVAGLQAPKLEVGVLVAPHQAGAARLHVRPAGGGGGGGSGGGGGVARWKESGIPHPENLLAPKPPPDKLLPAPAQRTLLRNKTPTPGSAANLGVRSQTEAKTSCIRGPRGQPNPAGPLPATETMLVGPKPCSSPRRSVTNLALNTS
jgi:hypothetical protein